MREYISSASFAVLVGGVIQDETEVAVIYKTRRELFEPVEKAIKSKHSYDVPCIVSLPVEKAQQDFVSWMREQVRT